MVIFVRLHDGSIVSRPDTTWARKNEDWYVPEYITEISLAPVLSAKVCGCVRSLAPKFASRYYDKVGFGVLLYPENFIDGRESGFAEALCIYHTSVIPDPAYDPDCLAASEGVRLYHGDSLVFSYSKLSTSMIEEALQQVSLRTLVKSGDIIAAELCPRINIDLDSGCSTRISGSFNSDITLDFNIIR